MSEIYPLYPMRSNVELCGTWSFAFIERPEAPTLTNFVPKCLPEFKSYETVPGVFDATIPLAGKRGLGIYRRAFTLKTAGRHTLQCGGFLLSAAVFVDGVKIGLSDLPYSGVSFDFDANAGEHEIIVVTDNRIESTPLWLSYYDFYAYGGIPREIHIMNVPERAIRRCAVTPLDLNGNVACEVLFCDSAANGEYDIGISFDSGKCKHMRVMVTNGKASFRTVVPDASVWTPDTPILHTICVDTGSDAIVERFGIRTVSATNGKILLNGKPIRLKGYNRHESDPDMGPALPAQIMMQDLKILKDMGCNFVRGCHYPQNQEFLDMCDQVGILVWEESLAWGNQEKQLADKVFIAHQIQQTALMVQNSCNHPSVILFGFLNECASDHEEAYPLVKALVDTIHEHDSSRLTTFASNRTFDDICFDLVDVISFNMYPAWYGVEPDQPYEFRLIGETLKKVTEFLAKPENIAKPFIISEIGAAAIYGCHDRVGSQWSEEYQAQYLRTVCEAFLANDRFSGLAMWMFADSRTYVCGQSRPRGFNNKGTLDEFRRPKLAFDEVKRLFRK